MKQELVVTKSLLKPQCFFASSTCMQHQTPVGQRQLEDQPMMGVCSSTWFVGTGMQAAYFGFQQVVKKIIYG